jgi:hypothetical protein
MQPLDEIPLPPQQPLLELCFQLGVLMMATTAGLALTLSAFVIWQNPLAMAI